MPKLPHKVAIVGCSSLEEHLARSISSKLLDTLSKAWPLEEVFTIKEDLLGSMIRKECKKYNYKRFGVSIDAQPYWDASAVAAARIIWRVPRVIVYWDGKKGLAHDCIEICQRMKKPFKMFEV